MIWPWQPINLKGVWAVLERKGFDDASMLIQANSRGRSCRIEEENQIKTSLSSLHIREISALVADQRRLVYLEMFIRARKGSGDVGISLLQGRATEKKCIAAA